MFAQNGSGENPLRIPGLDVGRSEGDIRRFDLTVQSGSSQFFADRRTETLGINGSYLGPTLKFKRFERVAFAVHNSLTETTSLHWHGFHLPPTEDGGPHQPIAPGSSWNPEFDVLAFGGTYWYHSHVMHKSGEQVYRGLAGMIVVEDEQDPPGLPNEYGVDDIPVILQDRRFDSEGQLRYSDRYDDLVMGMMGDTLLVNGTVSPFFRPQTKRVRFRLLNGANARTFNIALSDGRLFQQIASDGGLLAAPVMLGSLRLAPAERAEIVVEFAPGESVSLVSLGREPGPPLQAGAMFRMLSRINSEAFTILDLHCESSLEDRAVIPSQLARILRIPGASAVNTRRFELMMGSGQRSGDDRGPGTGQRNGTGAGAGGGNYFINGRGMELGFINERVPLNTIEIWEVSNSSPMMHPFHIHNGQFQLLDRNGRPPPDNELGWKDTVRVSPGETLRLIMQFSRYSDEANPYMYHCHILEHEDRGMMGQFVLV